MSLLQKQSKCHKPKRIIELGILPKTKKFGGLRYIKYRLITSSKVEANHKVAELKKKNRIAKKVKTDNGWVIYSRNK